MNYKAFWKTWHLVSPSYFYFSLPNFLVARSRQYLLLLLHCTCFLSLECPWIPARFPASLPSGVFFFVLFLIKCHLLTEALLGLPTENCILSPNTSYSSIGLKTKIYSGLITVKYYIYFYLFIFCPIHYSVLFMRTRAFVHFVNYFIVPST